MCVRVFSVLVSFSSACSKLFLSTEKRGIFEKVTKHENESATTVCGPLQKEFYCTPLYSRRKERKGKKEDMLTKRQNEKRETAALLPLRFQLISSSKLLNSTPLEWQSEYIRIQQ